MVSTFWVFLGVVIVISIIADSVVKIVKASTSGGSKELKERVHHVEEDLALLEQELEDSRGRIEVLEEIVTDEKRNLRQEIDDLAGSAR